MITAATTRILAAALVAALLFGSGWLSRGWFEASQREKQSVVQARVDASNNEKRITVAQDYTRRLTEIETAYAMPYWWQFVVRDRPGLADVDIGPVGLCLWKAWNSATPAKPCVDGEGAGGAAGTSQRSSTGPDGKP